MGRLTDPLLLSTRTPTCRDREPRIRRSRRARSTRLAKPLVWRMTNVIRSHGQWFAFNSLSPHRLRVLHIPDKDTILFASARGNKTDFSHPFYIISIGRRRTLGHSYPVIPSVILVLRAAYTATCDDGVTTRTSNIRDTVTSSTLMTVYDGGERMDVTERTGAGEYVTMEMPVGKCVHDLPSLLH
jgi:hypothetical protein